MAIKEWAEDERPREKMMRNGVEALSNAELLAVLVGSGSVEDSAVSLMQKVLAACDNSIRELSKKTVDELCVFKGIGPVKAVTIMAACELWKRRRDDDAPERKKISCSVDIYNFFYEKMCDLQVEECHTLLLNQSNRVIESVKISSGGLSDTSVDIRCILREALLKRATGVALCHNHPSGNVRPSRQDDCLTEQLSKACGTMNIRFLDHVIFTDGVHYSYQDEGRL